MQNDKNGRKMDIDDLNGLSDRERKAKREAMVKGILSMVVGFLIAICIALVIIALGGCRSVQEQTEKVVYVNRTDTVRQKVVEKDSVWMKDSVWVDRWRAGDTVFVTKTAERVRWRDRWRTDTCYVSKTDTVVATKEVVKTVTKRGKEWITLVVIDILVLLGFVYSRIKNK